MEKEPYKIGLSSNSTLISMLTEYQEDPRSRIFAKLADEYRKQGLVVQAMEIIDEGLEYHPGFSSALLVLAKCHFDKRRYADCLRILEKLLRDNAQNFRAERLRADVYMRLGQRSIAMASLSRVVEMVPNDLEAAKSLEELENLGSPADKYPTPNAPASTDRAPALGWQEGSVGEVAEFEVSDLGDLWTETIRESNAVAKAKVKSLESGDFLDVATEEPEEEVAPALADPEFATRTVAELYLRQGLKEKAKQVLEIILKREPNNEWAREQLASQFDSGDSVSNSPEVRQKNLVRAQVLERLLRNVRNYRQSLKLSV